MTQLVHDFIKKIISHYLISDCILLPPAHCRLLLLNASSKFRQQLLAAYLQPSTTSSDYFMFPYFSKRCGQPYY